MRVLGTFVLVGGLLDAGEVVARVHISSGPVAMGLSEQAGANVVATAGLAASAGTPAGGRILFDGADVTAYLAGCLRPGTLTAGGVTVQCAIPRGLLPPGDHVVQVLITLANQTSRRTAVRWTVIGNQEP